MEVSIIIATFNAGKTLGSCLLSLAKQKTEDVEIIVVDGGSKDDTIKIINDNLNVVDKWLSEPDKGIYDAWNKGIKLASGRWVMFVGADDGLLPNVLPKYVEFSKNIGDDVDLITAKAEFVDLEGKLIKIIGEPFIWDKYRYNMNISHGSTLHNRKLFDEVGMYSLKYRICADYEMFMRKGSRTKSEFYDNVVFRFAIGGASFSFACQKETFMIRKEYNSVPLFVNIMLCAKRCLGIMYKKIRFSYK